ncbi:hypothetical protein ACFQ4H_13310 [Micromonospora sonneratiae]|uniref:Uncharacterized protein n=2 Tax=Micromonospora sonneratiae TaxID=1184706 RepID=A0ABW3YCB0_9ACTN
MSPVAPAGGQRPGVVSISSYLLFLVAGLQVLGLIMALMVMSTFNEVYEELYAGTEIADAATTIATITLIGTSIVSLLIAAGLVLLAIFNLKGKNPSRIVTWVVGGIFVCCSGFGLLGSAVGGMMPTETGGTTTGPDPAEVQEVLSDRLPGFYEPLSLAINVITVIALLVSLILLALPAANEYFRKPQAAGWEPPVPGAAYPGYPQAQQPYQTEQPPYPGQQPPYPGGQQPPYPGGQQPPYPPAPPAS